MLCCISRSRSASELVNMHSNGDDSDDVAVREFTNANNSFAAATFWDVPEDSQSNFLLSPLSAETALAFAQSGCKGETAQEIRNALRLPDDSNKIEVAIKHFINLLRGNGCNVLHTANKLYILEEYPIKEEFKKTALEVYQADVGNIDFEQNEAAAENMNKWVEEKTNNKIKDLFSPNDFNEFTRVVIVNALYFKADWVHNFPGQNTDKQDFYVTAEDVIKVDMMHYYARYKRRFNYCSNEELDAQVLELPFESNGASMVVVLPTERNGLATLAKKRDNIFAPCSFQRRLVNISLPKFKIDCTTDLKTLLQKLGVNKAFDEEEADLSGIAGDKGDLVIDKVIQKAFIDVNEEGVEAAAATFGLVAVPCSASNESPVDFVVDHPFIFYIKMKNIVVFAGKVTKPVY